MGEVKTAIQTELHRSFQRNALAYMPIDLQAKFLKASNRYAYESSNRIVKACREAGIPVIWVAWQDNEDDFTPSDKISITLPKDGETFFAKTDLSAFTNSQLLPHLRSHGIDTLVISGVTSYACVKATIQDAVDNGISIVNVFDAIDYGYKEQAAAEQWHKDTISYASTESLVQNIQSFSIK